MVAIGSLAGGYSSSSVLVSSGSVATSQASASNEATRPQSDMVSISHRVDGNAMVMARIFHSASDANIPVETVDSACAISSHFLTIKDRSQLASLYEYASANSIDLNHVDALASDLARYRQIGGAPVGQRWDVQGYGVKYNFPPSDEKVANRVLSGSLIKNTDLDTGFIKNLMDPNQTPNWVSDFDFVEKAMSVLSPSSGNDVPPKDASKADGYFSNDSVWGYREDKKHSVFESKMPDIKLDLNTGKFVGNPQAKSGERLNSSSDKLLVEPGGLQQINTRSLQYLLDAFSKEASAPTKDHTRPLAGMVGTDLYAKLQSLK